MSNKAVRLISSSGPVRPSILPINHLLPSSGRVRRAQILNNLGGFKHLNPGVGVLQERDQDFPPAVALSSFRLADPRAQDFCRCGSSSSFKVSFTRRQKGDAS